MIYSRRNGLGDTISGAALEAARTTGLRQSIWLNQQRLAFLQGLLNLSWNSPQKQLLDQNIAAVQAAMARTDAMIASGSYETPETKAAGLQLVAQDAPIAGSSQPLSQLLAEINQGTLNQLSAFGDISVYNKYVADAAAYAAASAAVAKATDAAVQAGGTYIPPGVVLPSQFLPATVGTPTGSSTPPAGSPGTPAPAAATSAGSAFSVDSVPAWVWILGAAGIGITVFGGKK